MSTRTSHEVNRISGTHTLTRPGPAYRGDRGMGTARIARAPPATRRSQEGTRPARAPPATRRPKKALVQPSPSLRESGRLATASLDPGCGRGVVALPGAPSRLRHRG